MPKSRRTEELEERHDRDVARALRILVTQPEYLEAIPHHYAQHHLRPAVEHGKLVFVCGGRGYFTYARPKTMPSGPATPGTFTERGPALWVVDLVAMPDVSGIRAGLAMRRDLVHLGIANEGERVVFWRHRTQRYGYFIARSAR
jgi:hypothetical protein